MLICLVGSFCALPGWSDVIHAQPAGHAELHSRDLVELWRLGDTESDDVLFESIWDVAVDTRGRIYVVDRGQAPVYVLSDAGELVREIGRQGRGPGEFARVKNVFVGEADTVFVWDYDIYRITVFTPGDHLLATTVRILPAERGLGNAFDFIGVVPEGFLISYKTPFRPSDEEAARTTDVHLVSREGEMLEPALAQVQDLEMIMSPKTMSFYVVPFGRSPVIAASSTGLLYSAYSDSISVAVRSVDGRVKHRIRWEHTPVPVTFKDREARFSGSSKGYRNATQKAGIHSTKPAFQHFVVDDQENVWVQLSTAYGATTARWLILDKSGNVVDATLPANVRLKAIRGDRAYGVLTEDSGAEVLVAYAIQ